MTALDAPFTTALESALLPGGLQAVFQPIVDLEHGVLHAYEGLVRGPAGSPLEPPGLLFEAAFQAGCLETMEQQAISALIERHQTLQLPGLLFLNMTPHSLVARPGVLPTLEAIMTRYGLDPSRLVVELTETHAFRREDELAQALQRLRAFGARIALDDLGDGFASLKRWSLLQPDVVKIDRHFVHGLANDPIRQRFVRGIASIADTTGCRVVGEGVETPEDLAALHRLGVQLAQGYLIARPQPQPDVKAMALPTMGPSRVVMTDTGGRSEHTGSVGQARHPTAGHFCRPGPSVPITASCAEVMDIFHRHPSIYALPVLHPDQTPAGILRGLDVLAMASGRYFLDLYGKRSCRVLMDERPLMFDEATSLKSMSEAMTGLDERHLVDGFIVTRSGRFLGMGRITDLVRAVSEQQLVLARYANPLTGLPGNVPIDEHIEQCLQNGKAFVVAHWDIGHFKAFNDVYGYLHGDDIIRMTSEILNATLRPEVDFLGHVGGDDFVAIYGCADWEPRIQVALRSFDERIMPHFRPEHRAAGGYQARDRRGDQVFLPLPTLAAGVVRVAPGDYATHLQLAQAAAEAKRLAKGRAGSNYFVERRHPARHRTGPAHNVPAANS